MFQHSLMNLGVETHRIMVTITPTKTFQHSLMNLGVETHRQRTGSAHQAVRFSIL